MKFVHKTLGLLLASLALSSCGGGGGDGHGAFESPQSGNITLTASTTTLPLNTTGVDDWAPGSLYSVEVDILWRNADGTVVSGHDLSCSISPSDVASIRILDKADTQDVDESTINWGNVQVHSDTGHAICWVYAFPGSRAGNVTLSVGAVDPITGGSISASKTFTVQNTSGPTPASVIIDAPPAVYIQGSNGAQNAVLRIGVFDGGNQPVPNPNGFDNLQVEIVTDQNGGARLSANSASGPVSGTTVATHTTTGIATVSFQSGTVQGPIQIRATADRSDNNVTNGITDPVSTTSSVIVSDGKLYSLTITSPNTNAIRINTVSGDTTVDEGTGIPVDPDATYSLTVSALGTDRQGNPVLPGTAIRFGSIDEPVGTFDSGATANQFLLSGSDGDPDEGGTDFVAPTGHFTTAGGGAGPGDALVVFGKTQHGAPAGNEDLESAVTVSRVNSATDLTVSSAFNNNDTTGTTANHGPVLPYIIGRSQHGNIGSGVQTNEIGVAHTTLNYTASTLGHVVAMWAQGDGIDNITGGARRVTDAVQLLYPGVAPAQLTAFPSPIPGNTTYPVTVCLTDALLSPIQGIPIGFQLQLTGGTGNVDGNGTAGTLDNVTGPDGCVVANVTTQGVPASTDSSGVAGTVTFGVGDATASVDIVVQLAFLSAAPTVLCPGSTVAVTAFTTTGDPAPGVDISATCTSGFTPNPASATTGSNGVALFQIQGDAATANGQCTFSAGDNLSVAVTVGFPGGPSPPCGGGN